MTKPLELKKFLTGMLILILAFAGAGVSIGVLIRMVRWIGGI